MNRYILYPPNLSSESAQDIKDALKAKGKHCFLAKRDGEYCPKPTDLIIGWGYSRIPVWAQKAGQVQADWLNPYNVIYNALDKGRAFKMMENGGVALPERTEHISMANKWLKEGHVIFARQTLTGMRGAGIVVVDPKKHEAPPAMLYVKHFPAVREYRVYVFRGKVIDVLEKRRGKDYKGYDWVKSEEHGWVFCRQYVNLPPVCGKEAVKAIKSLSLDFGGVDVLYKHNQAVILEVNTMPGVFGSGAKIFAETFINYHEGK